MLEFLSYLSYLSYFRWRNVLDIVLIAFLFYQCYLWVRGSRAFFAAIGLAVIGSLAFLSHWSGLILAAWLFQSLWSVIWLIIVIVFQAELRHILERMSLLYVLRGPQSILQRETLEELTEALFELAHDKIGALVVLPQRDSVEVHLRAGLPVEGLVSRELLRALFLPPAPTHDGAVVIQANRIERAACFLPMTTAMGLPADYGARHRAALGLTERCDALCLMVSEERGTVALARQGKLLPSDTAAQLRQELEHTLPDAKTEWALLGWLWQALTDRLWAKGLALALAAGLWMTVAGQQSAEIGLTIPVEYQHLAPMIELRGDVPADVTIRLRGPQLALDALRSSPLRARISLERLREGLNYVSLTSSHIALPPGVELTDIRPALLAIDVRSKDGHISGGEQ